MKQEIQPSRDLWSMEYRFRNKTLRPYAALRSFLVTDDSGRVLYDGTDIQKAAEYFGSAAIKDVFMKRKTNPAQNGYEPGQIYLFYGRRHIVKEVFEHSGTPIKSFLTIALYDRVLPNQMPIEYTLSFERAKKELSFFEDKDE